LVLCPPWPVWWVIDPSEPSAVLNQVYNNVAYDLLDDKRQLQLSASRKSEVTAVFGGAPEGEGTRVAGLNGKHPPACSCRLCFRAQEQAKAAKAAKRRAGGVGSPVSTSAVLPGRSKQTQAEVDRSGAPSSSSFATVGETLWALDCDRDVAKLARHVEASRSAGSHQLNARSSRSHCLVRLHVDSGGGGGGGGVLLQRQFWFVDLAGSERTQKSGVSGQRKSTASSSSPQFSSQMVMHTNQSTASPATHLGRRFERTQG
jgi:hypothetical protein